MKKKQRADISPETIPFADQAQFYNSSCFKACQYVPGSLSNTENSCCSNNRNREKKETAKKNSGCTCLCLEFPTREAVNALADEFKEVASPIIRKETAKKNSGCICLCLEFPTREAVNALADKFKEVQSNYTF